MAAFDGWCPVCGWEGTFVGTSMLPARDFPCGGCRAAVVFQAEAAAILDEYERGAALTLDGLVASLSIDVLHIGRTGPVRERLRRIPGYEESSFDAARERGAVLGTEPLHTNQDHQRLTHHDERFDLLVSSHVLEHLPDWRAALAEAHRVLRPGGRYVFSIPGRTLQARSTSRAEVIDGEVVHHEEPQYHNAPEGHPVLVFTEFGGDLVDTMEEIGFVVSVRRVHRVIQRAAMSFTIVATKPR